MNALRAPGFFLAGTDTGSGKTHVTVGLLRAWREAGLAACGMKPIASGTIATDAGSINPDVVAIAAESRVRRAARPLLADLNPYCFDDPLSPHLAAARAGVSIDLHRIAAAYERLSSCCDVVLVEGTGGWLSPVSLDATMADVARQLALPIVMVVGLRLGCLSHALLTAQGIERSGLRLVGWIANAIEPDMLAVPENIDTLRARLPAPLLATLPHERGAAAQTPQISQIPTVTAATAALLRSAARALLTSAAVTC